VPGSAGLWLAAWFVAGAPTNQPPLLATPPLVDGSTNFFLKPLKAVPIVRLGGNPGMPQPLQPSVYQTRPYSIILVVPKTGLDDHCVASATGANSRMPVVKPELRLIPILPSK